MNFEALKSGFLSYLEEKKGNTNNTAQESMNVNSGISIFMFSNEFKDYLVEEVGADISIFSKSINEIMSMELVDGKLVENTNSDTFEQTGNNPDIVTEALNDLFSNEEIINALDTDKSGDLNIDEMGTFLTDIAGADENGQITFDNMAKSVQSIHEGTYNPSEPVQEAESSGNILNRLLDSVYENKTVIKTLDLDGDGKLSDEEKAKFEEFIKGYDGDGDELTEADIKRAFDDIMEGKFSYDSDLSKKAKEIDKKTEEELAEKTQAAEAATPSTSTQGTSSGGGVSSGGSAGSSNSFSISNDNGPKSIENMSLEELESEKQTKESEVKKAQDDINAVHSGSNEAVKNAQDDYEQARTDYDNAVKNDDKISSTLKDQREQNLNDIEQTESDIDNKNIEINNQEASIAQQETTVAADQSNLNALKSALQALPSSDDDPEKQAEIASKKTELQNAIQAAETKLQEDKTALEELKTDLNTMKEELKTLEDKRDELETAREQIESDILANCSDDTKTALANFNKAKENVKEVKERELQTAEKALSTAKTELDKINNQINIKKAEKTEKEYSISDFDFDFELTLSDTQKSALEAFKQNWEENHDKYEAVEEATGMPAELVAAIHWREGSGNFNTYLHNGQKLGQPTTITPVGICFDNWTDAAIDAVTRYGGGISSVDPDDIQTYYDYAERYNGLGYKNKGLPSPYVWAGTSNYTSGKYVADGVFDANHVDQQLGVAVMLQALLS